MKLLFYATVGGSYTRKEIIDASEYDWKNLTEEEKETELKFWLTNYLDYGWQLIDEE